MTLSVEWDRIQYATILDSLREELEQEEDFRLDDGNELHGGFEYVFIRATPVIALRIGAWFDPDHRIRFVGDDAITRALLRAEGNTFHYAGGIGIAFQSFQLDLGVDLSSVVDTLSVSAIFSF